MMLLYEAVRNKLGNQYKNVFYQTMREDKERDVGIYLYESANDLEDLAGDEVYNSIKVHVQVNANRNVEGMANALDYLTKFTRRMENEQSAISGVTFIEAKHLGPRAISIGKNKFDILICRSVIDLKYIIEG